MATRQRVVTLPRWLLMSRCLEYWSLSLAMSREHDIVGMAPSASAFDVVGSTMTGYVCLAGHVGIVVTWLMLHHCL